MKAVFLHPKKLEEHEFDNLIDGAIEKIHVRPAAWQDPLDPESHVGYVIEMECCASLAQLQQAVGPTECTLLPVTKDATVEEVLNAVGLKIVGAESMALPMPPAEDIPEPEDTETV